MIDRATPIRRAPQVDMAQVDPATRQAAEGMEAMFLDYLMQTMRKTIPKSEMSLENGASEIYRGMLDSEAAQRAARAGGVGLAEQIVAYLQQDRYTHQRQVPTAKDGKTGTGGTR
ncbi:MAG: rod-binding protein [Oligoflexia bacterium]|jgi:Rod binding domain-containing protein